MARFLSRIANPRWRHFRSRSSAIAGCGELLATGVQSLPQGNAGSDAFILRPLLTVIDLAYDTRRRRCAPFWPRHPVSYPIAIDVRAAGGFPAPRGLPMTWLIAPDGRWPFLGRQPDTSWLGHRGRRIRPMTAALFCGRPVQGVSAPPPDKALSLVFAAMRAIWSMVGWKYGGRPRSRARCPEAWPGRPALARVSGAALGGGPWMRRGFVTG